MFPALPIGQTPLIFHFGLQVYSHVPHGAYVEHINLTSVCVFIQCLASAQLPITFIDCTGGIIDADTKYVEANGHLAGEIASNGTMQVFVDNDTPAKVIIGVDITTPFQLYITCSVESLREL
jgi:hypothetical protein